MKMSGDDEHIGIRVMVKRRLLSDSGKYVPDQPRDLMEELRGHLEEDAER